MPQFMLNRKENICIYDFVLSLTFRDLLYYNRELCILSILHVSEDISLIISTCLYTSKYVYIYISRGAASRGLKKAPTSYKKPIAKFFTLARLKLRSFGWFRGGTRITELLNLSCTLVTINILSTSFSVRLTSVHTVHSCFLKLCPPPAPVKDKSEY